MTEFIKLPYCGDWINPALIVRAKLDPNHGIWIWFANNPGPRDYRGDDATALAAALDAMSIKEGM